MAIYFVTTSGNNTNNGLSEISGFADPGYASTQMGDGDVCYVKNGTYTIVNTVVGSGGPIKFAQANLRARMEGYNTVTGDRCTGINISKPLIIVSTGLTPTGLSIIEAAGNTNEPHYFIALKADGNNRPNVSCFKGSNVNNAYFVNCEAVNANGFGFQNATCHMCYAGYNSGTGFNNVTSSHCVADNNSGWGYVASTSINRCVASRNLLGGIFAGFNPPVYNCTAYLNSGVGISAPRNNNLVSCISVLNQTFGYSVADHVSLDRCVSYGNGSARLSTTPMYDANPIILSGDPFVSTGNFTPSSSVDGLLLRNAGINPYGYTGFLDAGAVQSQGTGIDGGTVVINNNIIDPLTHTIPGV